MRCLEPANPTYAVDSYEVHQPGAGDADLLSPYMGEELDLEGQVLCRDDCAGLCVECGENLNTNPHEHEKRIDPRWAKLSELK